MGASDFFLRADEHFRLCTCSDAGRRSVCVFFLLSIFWGKTNPILDSPMASAFAIRLEESQP
jgi:hypothetical protein